MHGRCTAACFENGSKTTIAYGKEEKYRAKPVNRKKEKKTILGPNLLSLKGIILPNLSKEKANKLEFDFTIPGHADNLAVSLFCQLGLN